MFEKAGILFLYAETPLHAGSGIGVGDVDLAIQREKHTEYPFIQAAGVKGAMRDVITARDSKHIERVETLFGPEPGGPPRRAGVLSFTEARLLLFPVWSLVGVFAWITCPAVLRRFQEDLALVGVDTDTSLPGVSDLSPANEQALIPEGTKLTTAEGQVVLEDITLKAAENQAVKQVANILADHALPDGFTYWADKLRTDLVVVNDRVFGDFIKNAPEVISRVRIGDTGTVAEGPWDEEYLPAETLLYSLVLTAAPRLRPVPPPPELQSGPAVLDYLKTHLDNVHPAQIGGNQTLGRGLVSVRFHRPEDFIVGKQAT